MRKPTITPYTRRRDGKTVYRVYDSYTPTRKGRVYIGTADSQEDARKLWAEYQETGAKRVKPMKERKLERKCWITKKPTRWGSIRYELVGHDHGQTGNRFLGSTDCAEKAKVLRDAYLEHGIAPPSRRGQRGLATHSKIRQTKEFIQTPKHLSVAEHVALRQEQRVKPLTDERKEMMRRMLAKIDDI